MLYCGARWVRCFISCRHSTWDTLISARLSNYNTLPLVFRHAFVLWSLGFRVPRSFSLRSISHVERTGGGGVARAQHVAGKPGARCEEGATLRVHSRISSDIERGVCSAIGVGNAIERKRCVFRILCLSFSVTMTMPVRWRAGAQHAACWITSKFELLPPTRDLSFRRFKTHEKFNFRNPINGTFSKFRLWDVQLLCLEIQLMAHFVNSDYEMSNYCAWGAREGGIKETYVTTRVLAPLRALLVFNVCCSYRKLSKTIFLWSFILSVFSDEVSNTMDFGWRRGTASQQISLSNFNSIVLY